MRLLLKYGAQCSNIPGIVLLAGDSTAPQDLVDMFAQSDHLAEALCTAIEYRCTETVLHLIRLGANVDKAAKVRDSVYLKSHLPIFHLFNERTRPVFSDERFRSLLPSQSPSVDILRPICSLLKQNRLSR